MRSAFLLVCVIAALGLTDAASAAVRQHHVADSASAPVDAQLAEVRTLLQQAEGQIDFAKAKLTIDRLIDPTINVVETSQQIDVLADRIRTRFPPAASSQTKLELLVTSLSQPGTWNSGRPFRYDLNDPFGKAIQNKLLSTYLTTRQGNCVSMPILLVVLGQKLGLEMTLTTAPEHVLAKFRNDQGQWINIEATSFGTKRDASYQQEMGITQKAMTNGIYLRPLSQRESVVVMLSTLMEFYGQQGNQQRRIEVADLALKVDPKSVVSMLQKGNAYYRLMQQRYMTKYQSRAQMTEAERQDFAMLEAGNARWFREAEMLGWTEPTARQNADYQQVIQRTKDAQQGNRNESK